MPTNPETAPVLLDTSAVIAHMIGHAKISQRIKAAERCFIPLTALGELRHGFHKSQRQGRTKEAAKIERLLRSRFTFFYRWIAEHLCMGAPSYVQSLVSRQKREKEWRILKIHGKLDPFS